jgi:site-specific DNA-adenine methylase
MTIKFLPYSGSKINYVGILNTISRNAPPTIYYCEPFLGSGAFFLNKTRDATVSVISDVSSHLIRVWDIFSTDFNEYLHRKDNILSVTGRIDRKDGYYKLRYLVNNMKGEDDRYSVGMYLLYCSCINSFPRFGPGGFNQSCGFRDLSIQDRSLFDHIRGKLLHTLVGRFDYLSLHCMNLPNTFWFVDPPYRKRRSSYAKLYESQSTFEEWLLNIRGPVMYTDVLDYGIIKRLGWKFTELRRMRNTAPVRQSESNGMIEAVYYNF